MEPEMLLKILAVCAGVALLLVFNFVDFSYILDKILFKKKENVVTPDQVNNDEIFLHIVDLWYQLRESCENQGLSSAVKKIDEVFPLLNHRDSE